MIVYIASPLGFSESTRRFNEFIVDKLRKNINDVTILNPWDYDSDVAKQFKKASEIHDPDLRIKRLHEIDFMLGEKNVRDIERADAVLAILDGVDVDSGTAAEIGFAFAKNKLIIGYRGDIRKTGDNEGVVVNLQVQYFIEASGGNIVDSIDDAIEIIKSLTENKLNDN